MTEKEYDNYVAQIKDILTVSPKDIFSSTFLTTYIHGLKIKSEDIFDTHGKNDVFVYGRNNADNIHLESVMGHLVKEVNQILNDHQIPYYIDDTHDDYYVFGREGQFILTLTYTSFSDISDEQTRQTLNNL